MASSRRVAVLGLGSVLMGDDAFGPYVASVLEADWDFDETVEVLDAGTPGLDLYPFVAGVRAAIVIDTIEADAPAGTLRLYRDGEVLQGPPLPRTSPHQPGLREALMAADLTDCLPGSILLVGCVGVTLQTGAPLSEPLRRAVPAAVDAVLAELERLGHPARPRANPSQPNLWWERRPDATAR